MQRNIVILAMIAIFAFLFLYFGITSAISQSYLYHEANFLENSGAHCTTGCGFWDFFLWPTVFIILGIAMIILELLYWHFSKR